MDPSELASYEQQLAQVQSALAVDEGNAELRTLEAELANLIDLTRQLVAQQGQSSGSTTTKEGPSEQVDRHASKPAGASSARRQADRLGGRSNGTASPAPPPQQQQQQRYAAGGDCDARYAADGRWYPARVVAVGGSAEAPVYTILFKGYGNTEMVTADALRPVAGRGAGAGGASVGTASVTAGAGAGAGAAPAAGTGPTRAGATSHATNTADTEAERERKRKRSDKKTERQAGKTAAANAMQSSWQKFAKKAEKKGTMKAERSMFKTPDDPLAKVGVVGAGRGMTQYHDRKKHTYDGREQ